MARPSTMPTQPDGALHDADGDQRVDARRERRRHAGDDEEREAAEQHRAPAETVGEGADHDLRQRHRGEEERQDELDAAVIGGKGMLDRRQRGHDGVDGERAHRRDGDQREHRRPADYGAVRPGGPG